MATRKTTRPKSPNGSKTQQEVPTGRTIPMSVPDVNRFHDATIAMRAFTDLLGESSGPLADQMCSLIEPHVRVLEDIDGRLK